MFGIRWQSHSMMPALLPRHCEHTRNSTSPRWPILSRAPICIAATRPCSSARVQPVQTIIRQASPADPEFLAAPAPPPGHPRR